ncbi:MAG: conjugal transfer protein TraV [Sphingomonas sp.]|uniref:conjugal transfer protein TraV n=1 Tax=Sphingomonas sp. TaxID=28214 RepID=UPI002603F817|nr:conjugal transfer protein TraV [Sphingomonas sp.]MDK2767971.1 conjugal transfer protein TraV [Sphingomonas sp.]
MTHMPSRTRLIVCAGLAAALSGCTTFGTNIQGDFSCRAPKGGCAPSQVIDAGATAAIEDGRSSSELARVRAGVAAGDTGRTSERTLRIVFPAHVDKAGTLHDEAVAWAVVENPRWAAELRRKPGEDAAPPLMRQLGRQLRAAQEAPAAATQEPDTDLGSPFSPTTPPIQDSPVASPLVLPSTAREAVAGAKAPAVEGFDMSAPLHDRTPRPGGDAPLTFPSIEAIEAAKAPKDADAGKTSAPAQADKEPK